MKKLFKFGENLGEIAKKSLKIQSCFQISQAWFLCYFSQSLHKIEQFFHAVLEEDVCLIGSNYKLSNFWERTSPKNQDREIFLCSVLAAPPGTVLSCALSES